METMRMERLIKSDIAHYYMLQINLEKMQERLDLEMTKENYDDFMIDLLVKEIRSIKRELKKYSDQSLA